MWLTSSLFNQIASERIEVLVPLKYLLIGGEVLNAKWVDLLNQKPKHPQIINGYGPTENTTFTTTYNIPNKVPRNRIPIGKPILGTHVYHARRVSMWRWYSWRIMYKWLWVSCRLFKSARIDSR